MGSHSEIYKGLVLLYCQKILSVKDVKYAEFLLLSNILEYD